MSLPSLDTRKLRKLAGDLWFARGEAYFQQGRVNDLNEEQDRLSAVVKGTRNYRVQLWTEEGAIAYSCTCPLGDDEEFCKHCVAVALAWLENTNQQSRVGRPMHPSQESDLRTFLQRQDKEKLVEIVLHEAAENRNLHERLELEAARLNSSGVDLSAFRKSIAGATRTGGFVDYYAAPRYARRIQQVIDSLAALLDDGHAKPVVELTEFALAKLAKAIGEMDDSDGHMSEILSDLQELHHRASQKAGEDPVTLAKRLFEWELKSDWEIFYGAADSYADVFGAEGLAEYQRLAEAEWAKVAALKPGSQRRLMRGGLLDEAAAQASHKRFRITSIMETLAGQSGDHEALVAIKRRDLSHPYAFLEIAEIYRKAKQHDQALDWAEQGMRAFPHVDWRLSDFLTDEYHRRGRHAEAMALAWAEFVETPGLDTYRKLQANAQRIRPPSDKLQFVASRNTLNPAKNRLTMASRRQGTRQTKVDRTAKANSEWPSWRDKALAHLRAVIKRETPTESLAKTHSWQLPSDRSSLVKIFLWEKDYEAAWQEATTGGCTQYLWLQLADAIARDHPDRALPIYKELITPTLEQTNNAAYDEAIKLLRKLDKVMSQLDRTADFDDYLIALRVEHKRKRNFIKLLDKMRK
jgi:uncharacterized Zn finger protein